MVFWAVFFHGSKPWNQGFTLAIPNQRSADPSNKKKCPPRQSCGVFVGCLSVAFFLNSQFETSPATTSFFFRIFLLGEKKGKVPRFKIQDDGAVLVTNKSACHIFLCKALALAEEQYLRLRKCWWRIGWK